MASGFGTDVDEIVGIADNIFIVLYDNDRVAKVAERLENADETESVARMKSDTWLIEYVH